MARQTTQPTSPEPGQPIAFVSYASADQRFADRLEHSVSTPSQELWAAHSRLLPGTEWGPELLAVIAESLNFIALVSENYLASAHCRDELEEALRLGKKVIVVSIAGIRPDSSQLIASPWRKLTPLHWHFMAGDPEIPPESVTTLRNALRTDFEWKQRHAEWTILANRWDRAQRPKDKLLGQGDISDFARLLAETGDERQPSVESIHLAFLRASKGASQQTRNRAIRYTIGAASLAAIAVAATERVVSTADARGQQAYAQHLVERSLLSWFGTGFADVLARMSDQDRAYYVHHATEFAQQAATELYRSTLRTILRR